MNVCTLSSGSQANSTFIEFAGTRILIDAGLSGRGLLDKLESLSVLPQSLAGIFITHEHTDHVRGLKVLLKKYNIPVYANEPTAQSLVSMLPESATIRSFRTGEPVELNGMKVRGFKVPHDGAEPVGYIIATEEASVGVLTDCGFATTLVKQRLKGADMLIVESNYDEMELQDGPYPWVIKQRIRGRHGHLSNAQAASLISEVFINRPARVVLAHLSENCNSPELAIDTTMKMLSINGVGKHEIIVAPRKEIGPVLEI